MRLLITMTSVRRLKNLNIKLRETHQEMR